MSFSLAEDNYSSPPPTPPSVLQKNSPSLKPFVVVTAAYLTENRKINLLLHYSYQEPPKPPGLARAGKGYVYSYIVSHEIHVIHRTCFQSISP